MKAAQNNYNILTLFMSPIVSKTLFNHSIWFWLVNKSLWAHLSNSNQERMIF